MAVDEVLAIIENIIKQHKQLTQKVDNLEKLANDASALTGLEDAKEAFMPGRLDQKEGLQKMQELLETLEEGLRRHFHYEETSLLAAFEKHGGTELASALHSLLLEHEDIRERFTHSQNHVSELIDGGLARHKWEASAHDMRAHLSHTRKLLEAHAAVELELLTELRKQLRQQKQ